MAYFGFFIFLFLEILTSVSFADSFGVLGLFIEVMVSFFIGFALLLNFHLFLGDELNALRSAKLSPQSFISAQILRLLGAVLLIIPGVFSDIFGLLAIFGALCLSYIKPKNTLYSQTDSMNFQNQNSEIIDVEIIEKESK